jgi:hypothetical protein
MANQKQFKKVGDNLVEEDVQTTVKVKIDTSNLPDMRNRLVNHKLQLQSEIDGIDEQIARIDEIMNAK